VNTGVLTRQWRTCANTEQAGFTQHQI